MQFPPLIMGHQMFLLLAGVLLLLSTDLELNMVEAIQTNEKYEAQRARDFTQTMKALENITSDLQRMTIAGDSIVSGCKRQLDTASEAVQWISTSLPSIPMLQAANLLGGAKQAVSTCNAYLSWRNVSMSTTKMQFAKHVLLKIHIMLDQLHNNIELVGLKIINQSSSNWTTSFVGEDGRTCNTVDPTICSSSPCGRGKLLPTCVSGFAYGVTGGLNGKSYVVTSDDDNVQNPQPGSLRYGVSLGGLANGGVWITFARDIVISLNDMLWIRSGTTIDGRGFNVTVISDNIVLCGVTNVILHNFQINSVGESDTIHIFAGSTKIWVDHITSFDAKLGLASVLQGSTDVTISNSHLSNPNFNMLLGASDNDQQDQEMRVTVYRNWFRDSMQRMPHCRWGKCHALNNLYTNWGYYAMGARVYAKVVSENNAFVANRRTEVTPWFNGIGTNFDQSATIQSFGDLLANGTTFHEFLVSSPSKIQPIYNSNMMYPPIVSTNILNFLLPPCVGALFGRKLQQCSIHLLSM